MIYFVTHQTSVVRIRQSLEIRVLRAFGANLWNTLPENIKSITSLLKFKEFIKKAWPGPKYKCSLWK